MTREILVQDLPPQLADIKDLPSDWEPGILCSRQDVFEALRSLELDFDRSRPERLRIELGLARFLELILGPEELLFAFQVRFGDHDEDGDLVSALLDRLGFRALESGAPGGLFDPQHDRPRAS